MTRKYPRRYFVRQIDRQYQVWYANVGGDVFYVREFERRADALRYVDRMNRAQEER